MALHRTPMVLAIAATSLLVAGLACSAASALTDAATATPRPTRTAAPTKEPAEEPTRRPTPTDEPAPTLETEPAETPEPISDVLLEDDFGDPDSGWGEGDSADALSVYRDDEYVFEIYSTGWLVWTTAGADDLSNIHTTVTVSSVSEGLAPSFGIVCNYQDNSAFYYLGISPDGFYGIIRVDGDDDIFLTSDEDQWEFSDGIDLYADTYALEAVCADDGTLTLIVDGEEIASVQDTTYGAGDIGLFSQSFDEVPVEIHFDDLTVTALAE